jgi:hypothetical protein
MKDIGGDSVWVTSKSESFVSNGVEHITITYTVNVQMKILDLTGRLNGKLIEEQVKVELASAINGSGEFERKNPNGKVISYHRFVAGDLNVQTVKSMDEVKKTDHLSVIIDDAIDTKNPDGSSRPSGGWGGLGKVHYAEVSSSTTGLGCTGIKVDYNSTANTIVHEFGHNLGFGHELDGQGNVVVTGTHAMSYSKDGKFFDAKQLSQLDGSGGRPNSTISFKTTNNWFFHSSTNEEPFNLNIKFGDKMPHPIITPKVANDTHK